MDTEGNVVAEEYTRQPQTGSHVQTTISLPIQRAMEESLEQVILDLRQNGWRRQRRQGCRGRRSGGHRGENRSDSGLLQLSHL